MLHDFKARLYQETILGTAVGHNTLVVLPTGMGKTAIAIMLASARLTHYPNSKILILAPTRPLVQQHKASFARILSLQDDDLQVFTGFVKPEKRKELWKRAKIIFSTPQGLENDIINKNISLEEASLVVFDEAHRAVGDYSYNFIASQYVKQANFPRILGLTASPGSDQVTIEEVIRNLKIDKVEVRTDTDPDVKEYVQEIELNWIPVELPPSYEKVRKFLQYCYHDKLEQLKQKGILYGDVKTINKSSLLSLQSAIQAKIAQGEKNYDLLKAISILAEAMKVQHALELIETQGIGALTEYLNALEHQASTTKVKAVQNLVQDLNYRSARILSDKILESGEEHPKLSTLIKLINEEMKDDTKIIVFNQYRDQAKIIKKTLDKENISSKIFVGQQKRKNVGLSQKKQQEILEEFSKGEFHCLIATSVAEEGLDIPKVDLVIFYEPLPSAIRTIQRRGRTGRLEKGKVHILMTKGTRDESYKWVSIHKERRMYKELGKLKQTTLQSTILPEKKTVEEDKVIIFTDYREKNSGLLKELIDLGAEVKLQKLDVGDYLLSERVCAEIKRVPDFVDSIVDGRLISQLKDLKQYAQPVVILEGTEDIYAQRRVHPNAIRGMLSTIALGFGIPIIRTNNSKDTAGLLHMMAKQEQSNDTKYQFHKTKPMSVREQQEFLVSSIPGIGPTLAKPLLRKFGSPGNMFTADETELQAVELIGPTKAKNIRTILDQEYK